MAGWYSPANPLVFALVLIAVLAFILTVIVWVFVSVLVLVLVVGLAKRVVGDVAGIPLPIVVRSARKWGGGDRNLPGGRHRPRRRRWAWGMGGGGGGGKEEAVRQWLARCFRIWQPQTLWERHG